ncbi:hypothetical protein MTR_7g017270 [Medicago truncatula]|uniref:Uncharacterized protein n=1 Tax=Medicago truncatula TaxID=3880 RepID=A2Q619_MEDTR|nr:hypothetical protein MtrDRAFT_AC172742g19v1 [Medicago truncatula]AES77791.1 hypothetical protein MTR_7g017270 [Medicago truncatula]
MGKAKSKGGMGLKGFSEFNKALLEKQCWMLLTIILLGEDSFDFEYVWRDLLVLNGSIALISNYSNVDTFHISILGEFGVKERECPIGDLE